MERITAYKTKDGKIHESKKKAVDYWENKMFDDLVKPNFSLFATTTQGEIGSISVMEFLTKNKDLIMYYLDGLSEEE